MEKETSQYINTIKEYIKNQLPINEPLIKLTKNLNQAKINAVRDVLKEIFNLMLINYDCNVVVLWREIIQHYGCKEMMDGFFDFYWVMRKNVNISNEVIVLYDSFGIYYLKYMQEIKEIEDFKEIVSDLQATYNECVIQLKKEYA